jgi:hypothetical protein
LDRQTGREGADAIDRLRDVLSHFAEGAQTADVLSAQQLLQNP